jgi:hypothetical protein
MCVGEERSQLGGRVNDVESVVVLSMVIFARIFLFMKNPDCAGMNVFVKTDVFVHDEVHVVDGVYVD